ncbi:MAG: hypothetical protein ACYDEN_09245 [Acidimicrobiales bacterium]
MTSTERWVLLGLAPPRAPWFREVTRWATSGALPAEFVKCRSAEEVRARLAAGRPWSALVVDAASPGLDRDLVALAASAGVPVLVVRAATGSPGRETQGRRVVDDAGPGQPSCGAPGQASPNDGQGDSAAGDPGLLARAGDGAVVHGDHTDGHAGAADGAAAAGMGATGLGPTGLGPTGLGPTGLGPTGLGATAVLPPTFGRDELLDVLSLHARLVGRGDLLPAELDDGEPGAWRGRLVVVCGPGGTGASTVAVALAQGLGGDVRYGGRVLLADLALRADLGVLHDAVDLGPGLQELVDAHRVGTPTPAEVVASTYEVPGRPYRLLLGLRRPAAWAALRPRATTASLDGLRRAFTLVVADVTGDVEGEADCGSVEVEERNHLARTAVATADVVVAVGLPGVKGVHTLAGHLRALAAAGVSPERLLPACNRAPRDPRSRAAISSTLATLAPGTTSVASPLWVRERNLEGPWRDARPLPTPFVRPLATTVAAHLERLADQAPPLVEPASVTPGSIGHWAADG